MRKFLPYINLIFSLASISLSIISICRSYPRNMELGFDYLGFIIGILGIIVAVLIGWQLFNALNLKDYVQQAEEAKKTALEAKDNILEEIKDIRINIKFVMKELKNKWGKNEIQTASDKDIEEILKKLDIDESDK